MWEGAQAWDVRGDTGVRCERGHRREMWEGTQAWDVRGDTGVRCERGHRREMWEGTQAWDVRGDTGVRCERGHRREMWEGTQAWDVRGDTGVRCERGHRREMRRSNPVLLFGTFLYEVEFPFNTERGVGRSYTNLQLCDLCGILTHIKRFCLFGALNAITCCGDIWSFQTNLTYLKLVLMMALYDLFGWNLWNM